jgi:hypothetical protein
VTLEPLKLIADRLMPDIGIVNMLDDSLLKDDIILEYLERGIKLI